MKILHLISKLLISFTIVYLAPAFAFEALVIGISDGDTITVLDNQKVQHKIRLAGIDAPEKGQDFGNKAKEHLSDLVYGKAVNLPDTKLDRYGRTVSRVFLGNIDAGLEMIKAGLAWHFKKYQFEQSIVDRLRYSEAENKARDIKVGLWSLAAPTRPEVLNMKVRLRRQQAVAQNVHTELIIFALVHMEVSMASVQPAIEICLKMKIFRLICCHQKCASYSDFGNNHV